MITRLASHGQYWANGIKYILIDWDVWINNIDSKPLGGFGASLEGHRNEFLV